jgi:capsular exopolysaccharide synthesis family protein
MSEIFNWLKKTDSALEAGPHTVNTRSMEPVVTSFENIVQKKNERVLVRPASAPSERLFSNLLEFDFNACDILVSKILDPGSAIGEQYRVLRAKFSLLQKEGSLQKILVTSALPNEGKTFTSCSIATVLAQEPDKRVLIIDADLRKPKAARTLGCMNADDMAGLCQILRGEVSPTEVLIKATQMNLFLLPSGGIPSNPSELLSSPNLESALRIVSKLFDWIIIDSPPVLGLADSTLIAPLCDATLLVIRSEHTPGKLLLETVQRIGRERICGIAMNRLKHFNYSRYYRYYHSNPKT